MKAPRPVRLAVTTALLLLTGLLILQALGYGLGFFFDPASGLGEFASPPPTEGDELTVALVGLVGAGMLGAAGVLALGVVLVLRGDPAGSYLIMAVGGVYVLAGLSVMRASWTWDAYFYIVGGGLVGSLAAAWRSLSARELNG
jgi:hypothetical protein